MHRNNKKKLLPGLIILIAALAAVVVGAVAFEKIQKKAPPDAAAAETQHGQSDKDTALENIEDSEWDGDNTLYFGDKLFGYDHRIETWLFIGTDNSGDETAAGENYHGAMADFLMLMVVDHTDDTYGFLQIDRNTITEVSMTSWDGETTDYRDMQICTAHWYGGNPEESAENTVDSVLTLLGDLDHIDGYYVLNMSELDKLNSAVGGVDVTIPLDMTAVDPSFTDGATVHLTDELAEKFIRARMALEDDANEHRMERQRIYLNAFFKEAVNKVKESPNFANELWDTLQSTAVTDMSGNGFSRIAETFRKDESKGILHFEGEAKIGENLLEDGEKHEEFYPSTDSMIETMTELFSLVPINEADDEVDLEEADLEDPDE
ncbi:MAG: LCP family protein [Eubacterium sp.]|nr:LCP family protein [Eubacterium sp.]